MFHTILSLPDILTHPPDIAVLNTQGTEYCFMEYFGATCPVGKQVRVLWALLGRMMTGRCISDAKNLDCYNDVGQHLRDKCEGKPIYFTNNLNINNNMQLKLWMHF